MTKDGKGMGGGAGAQHGAKRAGEDAFNEGLKEVDLAQDRMGDNDLQAEDAERVHNSRHAQAEAKRDPDDGVRRTFEKMDKDERARRDLGKKARTEDPGRDPTEDAAPETGGSSGGDDAGGE